MFLQIFSWNKNDILVKYSIFINSAFIDVRFNRLKFLGMSFVFWDPLYYLWLVFVLVIWRKLIANIHVLLYEHVVNTLEKYSLFFANPNIYRICTHWLKRNVFKDKNKMWMKVFMLFNAGARNIIQPHLYSAA